MRTTMEVVMLTRTVLDEFSIVQSGFICIHHVQGQNRLIQ